MKISEIKTLDNRSIAQESVYGKKIGILSQLLTHRVNVPNGFYFTIESKHGDRSKSIEKIKNYFRNFNDETSCFIVRSSMSLEDNVSHQFPGIFKSVKDVKTEDDLIKAIDECIESSRSEKALIYADNLKMSLKDLKISILVQEQIDIQYFGLAEIKYDEDFIIVEITRKDSFELVHGQTTPNVVRIYRESNYDIISNCDGIDFEEINFSQINIQFAQIKRTLKFDVIVEFGITKNCVHIFQAREHKIKGENPLRRYTSQKEKVELSDEKKEIFPNEKKWGLKGAAMEYFKSKDLFEYPLLLIENDKSLTYIRQQLKENVFCNAPITLRFSKGDDIGLKRFFVKDRDSAYNRVAEEFPTFQKSQQLLIIHPYLDCYHSYELLIDNDFFVLEHIPGLWETNNVLEPDVLYYDSGKNETEILRVKEQRQILISSPTTTYREFVEPFPFDFFESRLDKFKTLHCMLRKDFQPHLPLNFHFIESKENKTAFLNIRRLNIKRKSFENKRYVRDGSFFYVKNEEDLHGWDGRTPILLRLTTERGKEREFIQLASLLPKNVDVFINFGWLSHPAMILRECGIHVIPAYLQRDIKIIKNDMVEK